MLGTAARRTMCPNNTIAGREQLLAEPFGDHELSPSAARPRAGAGSRVVFGVALPGAVCRWVCIGTVCTGSVTRVGRVYTVCMQLCSINECVCVHACISVSVCACVQAVCVHLCACCRLLAALINTRQFPGPAFKQTKANKEGRLWDQHTHVVLLWLSPVPAALSDEWCHIHPHYSQPFPSLLMGQDEDLHCVIRLNISCLFSGQRLLFPICFSTAGEEQQQWDHTGSSG